MVGIPDPGVKERAPEHDQRTRKMLALMAELGMDRRALLVLAEFSGITVEGNDRKFVLGPVVLHQNGWTDTIPDWMWRQALAERLSIVFGLEPWIVGPSEIAAVAYPASMEHPFQHDMADLYLWAAAHACAKHFRKETREYWEIMGSRPVTDDDVLSVNGRLRHVYRQLAEEIRRKVIRHSRAEPRPKPPPPLHTGAWKVTRIEPKKADIEAPVATQYSIFDLK